MEKDRQLSIKKVQVIAKKTVYRLFVEENKDPEIIDLLERGESCAEWISRSHRENQEAIQKLLRSLEERNIEYRLTYGGEASLWPEADLLIALGGDGTLLEALRLTDGEERPVIGLHSTPTASVGYLCSGSIGDFDEIFSKLASGQLPSLKLPRIAVKINGKDTDIRAVNDILFAHHSPAATSRYCISWRGRTEEQRSSGLWISTPLGSTAAIFSAGGRVLPLDGEKLQFAVREPYRQGENYSILSGIFDNEHPLELTPTIPGLRLFCDGPRNEYPLRLGDNVRLYLDERKVTLYISPRFRSPRSKI